MTSTVLPCRHVVSFARPAANGITARFVEIFDKGKGLFDQQESVCVVVWKCYKGTDM